MNALYTNNLIKIRSHAVDAHSITRRIISCISLLRENNTLVKSMELCKSNKHVPEHSNYPRKFLSLYADSNCLNK